VLRLIAVCAVAVSVVAGCRDSDRADIEAVLLQWPWDFNARNLEAVCGLFADDAVLAYPGAPYPGAPDRNRDAFCDQMRERFRDPSKTVSYDAPAIKEIIVDGDLATVRLFWTLTVKDISGKVVETIQKDGVDVFRRQPDRSWKIHISHAFTK
jgi:ketosteroid isomerase-like protein